MGTFTKSFGAAGGYISGSKKLVDTIRTYTHSGAYAESISPVVLTQIIASMSSIMGVKSDLPSSNGGPLTLSTSTSSSTFHVAPLTDDDHYTGPTPSSFIPSWMPLTKEMRDGSEGLERRRRLAFNTRYLARGLKKLGFITYGHCDSPVVPLLLFSPGKMPMFHRLMLERGTPITTVVVGYPATPLVTSRVRFCVSASHIKSDIDELLGACDELGDLLDLKHGSEERDRWSIDKIINNAVELVNA